MGKNCGPGVLQRAERCRIMGATEVEWCEPYLRPRIFAWEVRAGLDLPDKTLCFHLYHSFIQEKGKQHTKLHSYSSCVC